MVGLVTNLLRDGHPALPESGPGLTWLEDLGTDPATGARLAAQHAATYSGTPPPPLSTCEFARLGDDWHCLGTVDLDARTVLHDDFTIVPKTSADGTAACDTPWTVDVNGTGSSLQAYTGLGLGVARLVAGATANRFTRIRKDNEMLLGSAADAHWMSTRAYVNELTDTDILIGLADTAATTYAFARFNTSVDTNWTLITSDGALSGSVTTATTPTAAWVDLDLVLVPGVFAALWVDGDGPYPVVADASTGVPATSDAFTPWVRCLALGASQRNLFLDYVHLDALTGRIANPATDELIGAR